jgi:hypothetical protein
LCLGEEDTPGLPKSSGFTRTLPPVAQPSNSSMSGKLYIGRKVTQPEAAAAKVGPCGFRL